MREYNANGRGVHRSRGRLLLLGEVHAFALQHMQQRLRALHNLTRQTATAGSAQREGGLT
eukprot:4478249-Prymnesium_polylepis.1